MEDVLIEVLEAIKPSEEERNFLMSLMDELKGVVNETASELGVEVRPYFVGSIAKDTYLAGDHDVDLFLAFPLDVPPERLREDGLKLARAVAEKLGNYEVAYAEHPYVRAVYRGISVDLVPCYDVKSWRDVRTAVDRSILHTEWVNRHVNGRNDEIRVLKRFLKGIGVYGSEVYIRGFSGYLAEILVITFGSFTDVLRRADEMIKYRVIDPENWLKKEPSLASSTVKRELDSDRPLIVIDPVDPRRNVSANLSWEKYGIFYLKSAEFIRHPSMEFFFPGKKKRGDYRTELRRRGTHILTLIFEVPGIVDDLLLPQVEKTAKSLEKALGREGFRVLGRNFGRNFIMLEIDRVEREAISIKEGPEFFSERAPDFYSKNKKVWIMGKRLYSEKAVNSSIVDVVDELLRKNRVSIGRSIREEVRASKILIDYVPRDLEGEAWSFLTRKKWSVKD